MIKMKKPKKPSKHIEFKEPSLSELLKDKKTKEQNSPDIKRDAPTKDIKGKKLRCATQKLKPEVYRTNEIRSFIRQK